jgi:hypothetical protein
MRRLLVAVCCLCGVSFIGCAHHQANQYSYAPPLAPPVYPQPQPVGGTVAPPVVVPAAPGPGGVPAAAVAPAAALPAGQAVLVSGDPCCPPFIEGGGTATPVVYETAGQTPPCPPAH